MLRHNLKNDLSVVLLKLEVARRRTEATEIDEELESAEQKVNSLVETSNIAREIESTIGADSLTYTSTDLERLFHTVCEDFERDHPDISIAYEAEGDGFRTDQSVLESLLHQLLENAIQHSDGTDTQVTLEATQHGQEMRIAVTDNGPGIPEHEVASLHSGSESSLEHGSGLGLWLVKWGIVRLGGELTFDPRGQGTTVTMTLPLAPGESD